jgi:hypothetical protein
VSVLLGDGVGGFGTATTFAAGLSPISIAIDDLNGDAKPDLAVADNGFGPDILGSGVPVLLGAGDGSFGTATSFAVGSGRLVQSFAVAIGDLNGDAKPDLAVANLGRDNVSVLLGAGDGGFGTATDFPAGGAPRSVAIGDLNSDAKPDLAVANAASDSVSVLLGDGGGRFAAAAEFAVGDAPWSVAIGDLNDDAKPDLVTADADSNDVSVLLNTTSTDTTPPTTTIALSPASPDGQNGWYVSTVHLAVTASDQAGGSGVAETRCVLDPTSPPTSFDAIPAGCTYTGGRSRHHHRRHPHPVRGQQRRRGQQGDPGQRHRQDRQNSTDDLDRAQPAQTPR